VTDDAASAEQSATSPENGQPSAGKPLQLDQFLKLCGVVETGGQAKQLIQGGEVMLNGEVETRRRKKLSIDDVIEIFGNELRVAEFFSAE
jgi:ribosome-associated protein